MDYLIVALDGTDKDASVRRDTARPAHRRSSKKLKESGNLICGGGLTGESGESIGSFMVLHFNDSRDFNRYLKEEPFIIEKVWKTIEVHQLRLTVAQGLSQNDT